MKRSGRTKLHVEMQRAIQRQRGRLPTFFERLARDSREMQISFDPLAERELNDAAQYYELESAGLGQWRQPRAAEADT